MAGMFNSASMAAELYADEIMKNGGGAMPVIRAFDTQNCSGGATLWPCTAEMAKRGRNASEIIAALTKLRARIATFFVLNSFVYIHRSGRVGGLKPILGSLFGVKPVFTFSNGVVRDTDVIKSGKKVNQWLIETFRKKSGDHSTAVIYHAMAQSRAEKLEQELKGLYPELHTMILSVGAVVGFSPGRAASGFPSSRGRAAKGALNPRIIIHAAKQRICTRAARPVQKSALSAPDHPQGHDLGAFLSRRSPGFHQNRRHWPTSRISELPWIDAG